MIVKKYMFIMYEPLSLAKQIATERNLIVNRMWLFF